MRRWAWRTVSTARARRSWNRSTIPPPCCRYGGYGTDYAKEIYTLDLKLAGLPMAILEEAIHMAKAARSTIIAKMTEAVSGPQELSPHAPRIVEILIDKSYIGAVIGPGAQVPSSADPNERCLVVSARAAGLSGVTVSLTPIFFRCRRATFSSSALGRM